MKEIFKTLSDKIKTDVPKVRWFDFDLGQLEQEQPPVSWPCVLFSIQSGSFEQIASGGQQADLMIGIRLAFKVFERTHSVATSFQNVGLQHIDTVEEVHRAFQGLSGTGFEALSRVGFATEPRADLRVYNLVYSCRYIDIPVNPFQPWDSVTSEPKPDLCLNSIIIKKI